MDTIVPKTKAQRLAELRAYDAQMKAKLEDEKIDREIADLELRKKFLDQGLVEGSDFEIISQGLPFSIVVKRGLGVTASKFSSSKMDDADVNEYILPAIVHPPIAEFNAYAVDHPFVRDRVTKALSSMFGANMNAISGKF